MVNSSPFVFSRISPVITTQYPTPLSGLSADVSSMSLRDKISQKNLVVKEKVKILKTDENIRKEILEIFAFHISLWLGRDPMPHALINEQCLRRKKMYLPRSPNKSNSDG